MVRSARLALVLAALLTAPRLIAQTEPIPAGRPPLWGLAAGYGFTVHLNHGRFSEHVPLLEPGVGFRVSSRLEYVVEGHLERVFTPGGYMLGVMPVGRRLYLGSGRTLPYVSIGGGLGWTDLAVEEIDRRLTSCFRGAPECAAPYRRPTRSRWKRASPTSPTEARRARTWV